MPSSAAGPAVPASAATDDVIARLTDDLRPVSRHAVTACMTQATLVGGATAFLAVALALGFRADIAIAARAAMFWIKLSYSLALGLLGLWALTRLSRPGSRPTGRLAAVLLPVVAVIAWGAWEIAASPPSERAASLLGTSWTLCPWRILAASAAPFVALSWAVRKRAPTSLKLTGAVLGVSAGGFGASAYALSCSETTAPFLAVWYTLGIALVAGLGAVIAPHTLRW